MSDLNELDASGNGKRLEANGFLVPILSRSSREVGAQHGALMAEHM